MLGMLQRNVIGRKLKDFNHGKNNKYIYIFFNNLYFYKIILK